MQTHHLHFGRQYNRTDGIETLMVVDAGTNAGRLTARRPTGRQWQNQRIATFVLENQLCAEVTRLFLSAAIHSAANGLLLRHRADWKRVSPAGNSSRSFLTTTMSHSMYTVFQTNPRSLVLFDQVSSDRLESHTRMPHAVMHVANVQPVCSLVAAADQAELPFSYVVALWLRSATFEGCVYSRPRFEQLRSVVYR